MGLSVLEMLRKKEQSQEEAEAAAAAKRRSIDGTMLRGAVQVRSDFRNGVGVPGRGRAARNVVALHLDGACLLPGMMARKQRR